MHYSMTPDDVHVAIATQLYEHTEQGVLAAQQLMSIEVKKVKQIT